MKTITIELTEQEAKDFRLFQQYVDNFVILMDAGVFDQKSASIVLNFDHLGTLQTVKRTDLLFSRKFSVL